MASNRIESNGRKLKVIEIFGADAEAIRKALEEFGKPPAAARDPLPPASEPGVNGHGGESSAE